MDRRLLDLLVCPLCKGPLDYRRAPAEELVCPADRLAFPVRDGIAVMLEGEARALAADDRAPTAAELLAAGASDAAPPPAP